MAHSYEANVNLENENSSHTLIVELVGYDKNVLDVGCSTGYLAEVLVQRGCRVTGIEIDPKAARRAEEHCERVIVGDVESLDLGKELDEGSFDVIIFGDVLEHLKDPLQALRRLKSSLGPRGYVVASIPNIAHGSVRLALMQGKFRYHSVGLLDSTHLRFFTRESLEQLFKDAGFLITGLRRTTRGIFDTEIEIDRDMVTEEILELVRRDPEGLTYQFVLTALPFGEAATLATYERLIYELTRKLRNFEELQRILDIRTEQLAKKEREVAMLAQEVAQRNDELARLEQFGRRDL
jgi:O-antigen biosynthesis protein